MKEIQGVKYYHRYADDIVVLHKDKAYLHALLVNISDYFHENLKLTVKQNYQVFPVDARGIDYLGYKTFHTHVLLRKSIKHRMFRAMRKAKVSNYKLKMAAYNGWLKHCNSKNLQDKIFDMSKRFSELGITVENNSLPGEKIKISKVIGKEIVIKDFRIAKSKYDKTDHCLMMQIEIEGQIKVIFTGSTMLKKQIEQINKEDFPIIATIENTENTYQLS